MFGKKKVNNFKKGMEAGAKPFVEKNEKLAENFEEVSEKLINNIKEPLNTIIDIEEEHDVRIEDLENARSFQLKSFESIDSLSDNEKKLFAGLIFTFASQLQNKTGSDSSELQKEYINAILLKLGVSSPQQDLPLESVANIQDSSKQLFLLSLLFEYAFLGNNSFDFFENNCELFDSFRFNKNDISNIQTAIEAEIKIRGVKGLVKKYEKPITIPVTGNQSEKVSSKSNITDYISEETKNYFKDKILTPRLSAGKALFDLGIKKLQIANNIFKPIVDEKNSWIYKCTEGFENGDMIAYLGAGIEDPKDCTTVLWFLYNDEELKNNPIFLSSVVQAGSPVGSVLINNSLSPLMSVGISKIAAALLSVSESQDKSSKFDNFCLEVSALCKKEMEVLNYIEDSLKSFYEKFQNNKQLSDDDMLTVSGIGSWFKKIVKLPLLSFSGTIRDDAEKELYETKDLIEFLLNPEE